MQLKYCYLILIDFIELFDRDVVHQWTFNFSSIVPGQVYIVSLKDNNIMQNHFNYKHRLLTDANTVHYFILSVIKQLFI